MNGILDLFEDLRHTKMTRKQKRNVLFHNSDDFAGMAAKSDNIVHLKYF